ncbi:hypothetical protein KR074_011023 [Drosophila pseudoananassae]|nr:hypothetical protein KR074_011023 [Drosophila pseudoananassae]
MFQTNRVLQKEQAQLFAIQKKLEKVLPVVQEALNSLKVEELHLKSMGIHSTTEGQGTLGKDPLFLDITERLEQSASEAKFVNSQAINLGVLSSTVKPFEEEVDSD